MPPKTKKPTKAEIQKVAFEFNDEYSHIYDDTTEIDENLNIYLKHNEETYKTRVEALKKAIEEKHSFDYGIIKDETCLVETIPTKEELRQKYINEILLIREKLRKSEKLCDTYRQQLNSHFQSIETFDKNTLEITD